MKDQEAIKERERELYGEVLNLDELQGELDELDALMYQDQLPSAAEGKISVGEAQKYQQEHGISQLEEH